jgi:Putative metal-binding motif
MTSMRRTTRTAKTLTALVAACVVALCAAPAALAGGRLLETGHDADWRCSVVGTQCHFLRVAVTYVRNGAPDPSRKLLVLDDADLYMRQALINAYGPGILSQMDVMAPQSAQFANAALTPIVYSAIVVASDQTCGNDIFAFPNHGNANDPASYCDLNRPTSGWPPPSPGTPGNQDDSQAIANRSAAIKAFFDAGGGLYVGSGADDGDGHLDDVYYSFIDASGGAGGSACQPGGPQGECLGASGSLALTPAGRTLGFTDGTSGTVDDINCGVSGTFCATHNSFQSPRAGSQLVVAETGPSPFDATLFEDANPPNTTITGGPGPLLKVARPVPVPVTGSSTATVTFVASEDTTRFVCSLDGGAATGCSSPSTFTRLAQGTHKLTVTSIDAAGNTDPTPAELSWLVATDRDRDGFLKRNPFGSQDCNDRNAKIHPGAKEIRGNRVDENCDGKILGFVRLRPSFPFHFTGGSCSGCIRFDRLSATHLPRRVTIRVRCSGPACHFSRKIGRARSHRKRVNLLHALGGRSLPVGSTVQISVTRRRTIGSIMRLVVVRRGSQLDVKQVGLCQEPGSRHPSRHCASIK